MKKVLIIVGTRPNFIKITQFKKVAENYENLEIVIAHTGQHYDQNMSKVFFEQFNLQPDYFLEIQAESTVDQMGKIISAIGALADEIKPDLIIAVGDVNSTLCASIVANKMSIKLAHLESGLRSRDRSMPEEINRILTDEITDIYFVTEQSGIDNLLEEGKNKKAIYFVGNTMIDTLVAFQSQVDQSNILGKYKLEKENYILFTMHRPSNVDHVDSLDKVVKLLEEISSKEKVIFPVHPRTINKLKEYSLYKRFVSISGLVLSEPLDYFAFQNLIQNARVVVTDSGGIQEETTFKQVPCITIRNNTERPSTIRLGTNQLIDFDVNKIVEALEKSKFIKGEVPPLWDGNATERILKIIDSWVNQ